MESRRPKVRILDPRQGFGPRSVESGPSTLPWERAKSNVPKPGPMGSTPKPTPKPVPKPVPKPGFRPVPKPTMISTPNPYLGQPQRTEFKIPGFKDDFKQGLRQVVKGVGKIARLGRGSSPAGIAMQYMKPIPISKPKTTKTTKAAGKSPARGGSSGSTTKQRATGTSPARGGPSRSTTGRSPMRGGPNRKKK